MNAKKVSAYDVGVIIGRFQVPDLHEAHEKLIQTVCNKHSKVIIFLGLSPVFDQNDPLDFEARKQMILAKFPNIILAYIADQPTDELWSKKLDEQIGHLKGVYQSVVLYGGRDSFMTRYSGKFPTEEIVQDVWVSGSEIRGMIKNSVKASQDFRHGAIWESWQQYPTVFPTVDIAVINQDKGELLLAQKPNEKGWRFVGGFTDPTDNSYEEAALRELHEEVPNIEVDQRVVYLGSAKIDDWRYRGRTNQIITHLYVVRYLFGKPIAGDDISATRWFKLTDVKESDMVKGHIELLRKLLEWWKRIENEKSKGKENVK